MGLGVSECGEGAGSLGVSCGQVKQAEVRGRGPPSPGERLDDVTLRGRGRRAGCFPAHL